MGLVIAFAGKSGSGKSTISGKISTILHWKVVSCGDYLRRQVVHAGGDPSSRLELQNLGQSVLATDLDGFCHGVLDMVQFHPGDDLLIDGIRHVAVHERIGQIVAPSESRLIFLSIDRTSRVERLTQRGRSESDPTQSDLHVVESELTGSIPRIADAIINAGVDVDEIVRECLELIDSWV